MEQNLRGNLFTRSLEVDPLICSGGLFLAKDTRRFLFLLRTQEKSKGQWGLVGGKKEPMDSTPYDIVSREIKEEVGNTTDILKVIPLELFVSDDQKFQYNTYVLLVEKEFIPVLNFEHAGYAWVDWNAWPTPLHRGVRNSLQNKIIRAKLELLLDLI